MLSRYVPRDWIFPVVLAIFVGVVVWFGHSIHDFLLPGANTVTVPSFVGQAAPDATSEISRLQLKSAIIGHTSSSHYPKGVIVNQQPVPGMHVRAGRQISLVVSDGVQTELMPDVRYQTLREAGLDLSRARLELAKTSYARSDDVPADHVIDQDPAPLVSVTEGTPIALTVSKGGQTQVRVPNFTNMSIDDARKIAASDHVRLGQLVWTPLGEGGPEHGRVVRQRPDAGAQINPYDVVSLQVSAGPHESGYIIHQTHVLTAVPQPDSSRPGAALHVQLRVVDNTGIYDLFNAYAQPGQKLEFNVTTVGTSVLDMYVNNQLVGESRLGVEPPNAYAKPSAPAPQSQATP